MSNAYARFPRPGCFRLIGVKGPPTCHPMARPSRNQRNDHWPSFPPAGIKKAGLGPARRGKLGGDTDQAEALINEPTAGEPSLSPSASVPPTAGTAVEEPAVFDVLGALAALEAPAPPW